MDEEHIRPNPLLGKTKLPGMTFRLPSGGSLYKDGELAPDVRCGEVHVYPMTALDEIVLKTPDKLFRGEAIDEIFRRCIPSVLKPMRLFTKDVDFLLVCLRKVTFGDQLEVEHQHTCENAKIHRYTFSINEFINNSKPIDPVILKENRLVVLPNNQRVMIRPLIFEDFIAASQVDQDKLETPEQVRDQINENVMRVISEVDGESDQSFIREWLEIIPTTYIRDISQAIDKAADWGPHFEVELVCKDCGEKMTVATPINPISFFS